MFDTNNDGVVSEKEFHNTVAAHLPGGLAPEEKKDIMKQAMGIFNYIDADGNGVATEAELHDALAKGPPSEKQMKAAKHAVMNAQLATKDIKGDVDAAFRESDDNKDNKISEKEFVDTVKRFLPKDLPKEHKTAIMDGAMEAFDLIDSDDSGAVTRKELHKAIEIMSQDPDLKEFH